MPQKVRHILHTWSRLSCRCCCVYSPPVFVPDCGLSQPYLVLGTLRDQIIYPHEYADMQRLGVTDDDLAKLLAIVDPARNITTEWGWSHNTQRRYAIDRVSVCDACCSLSSSLL